MSASIAEHLSTILVGAVVLGVITFALVSTIRTYRKGKSPCGCGCSGCSKS
ncbi:MAG: FeoB-associated Cys-rich membrane protein [Treponema sp.]|jgi:hypothetical protein|nr:FeoB-associated Cys-rich membrane protein [Treponema sp.]